MNSYVETIPMASTPEYRAFQKHYGELMNGLDPASVAPQAFARNLLTREENNKATHIPYTPEDKMTVILTAVGGRICGDPTAFHTFVEVLELELAFSTLVEKLKRTHAKFKQGGTDGTDYYGNGATPQRNPKGYDVPTRQDLIRHVKTTETTLLGLELGIDSRDMDTIEEDNRNNQRGALKAVLTEWTKSCEEPTWWAIVDVLRKIGENRLAKEIETKFCT